MNEYNKTVVSRMLGTVSGLEGGVCNLEEAQRALQDAISLLENDGSGVADAIRRAEADLETILFGTLLEEHVLLANARIVALARELRDM
ncbi:hypothetical protein DY023_07530 [Microbacterium bovistercoris]|uniref:Uncharacterized protein n=2 Tax=Microbacterium bovistercoris TaxID=2293570 RepID=A0A371NUS3_9MICO|nr:hypothetical protein DY023_07530 [Microbacterium bovistercoris]